MIFFVALEVSVSSYYLNSNLLEQIIHTKISTPLDSGGNYSLRHQDFHQQLVSKKSIRENLSSFRYQKPFGQWSCPRPVALVTCRQAWYAPREQGRCAEAGKGIDYKSNVWQRWECLRTESEPCVWSVFLTGPPPPDHSQLSQEALPLFADAEMEARKPCLKLQSQWVAELGFTPGSLALSVHTCPPHYIASLTFVLQHVFQAPQLPWVDGGGWQKWVLKACGNTREPSNVVFSTPVLHLGSFLEYIRPAIKLVCYRPR